MHRSSVTTITFFLIVSLIILGPFANTTNLFSSPAMAQGYDNYYGDSYYSKYPTDDKKYECRTGPFQGFFVSSVEFCKFNKFDDRKDHSSRDNNNNNNNNRTGTQGPTGPQGPAGPAGTQGLPGLNGTNGNNGTNGVNGTNIEPCVACLLDALAKLDSGAILVNVTANLERGQQGPSGDVSVTLPLTIDVDVAILLQQQLAESLGLDVNATIFEICAAIDAQQGSLDVAAILDALADTLVPIVTAQITQLVNQIAIAISEITGEPIDQALIDEILASIDIDDIVVQITANVQVSLEILEECLDLTPIPPIPPPATTETLTVIKNVDCQANSTTCANNPIQPSNFTIVINGTNPIPDEFSGESTGTNVELEPGPYNVTEQGLDSNTPQACANMAFEAGSDLGNNLFICTNFSEECSDVISAGESLSCIINNVLIDTSPASLTVNKTIFGCNMFPNSFSMDCRSLNNSSQWISCNDPPISNTIYCIALNENSFDIEVNASNNQQINQFDGSAAGTTITNLQPGTYRVNEIEYPNNINQLGEDPGTETFSCVPRGFADGGTFINQTADIFYENCFEYEDQQGNNCNTITLGAGEHRTCTVKNYISFGAVRNPP